MTSWPTNKLGQVSDIVMGQSPDGESYNTDGIGVPLINGPVEFSPHPFGTTIRSKFTTSPTKFCKKDDLILCVRGSTTGRMNIAGFDACIGRGVAAIRAKHFQPWINHYIHWKQDEIYALGTGATFPNVSGAMLSEFNIPLPPLPEQQRIVAILDEAFEAIATAKANTEKNLQNARALFESALGDTLSRRDGDWIERRLSEVSSQFGRGRSRNRPRNDPSLYGGDYPFIQTGDVRNSDHYIEAYEQTYNEAGLAQSKLWPAGTVCITIAANIAETGILTFDSCFPDSVIGVVPDDRTDSGYLEYLLQGFKVQLQAQGKGSAQMNINMATFEDTLFPFPSLDVQRQVATKLDTVREHSQTLKTLGEQKLRALEELQSALLHQAFTGNL